MPRLTCLCISDDPGSYNGKQGHVTYQQLALMDQDPVAESRMVNTFDYRMTPEEKEKYAGKCLNKAIVIDVKNFEVFNSRLKVSAGRIVEVKGLNGTAPKL